MRESRRCLNALSRRDVAIVSDEPGTTRDVVEARLDVGGVPVLFMDTAGIRAAPGKVEREGIRRSLARAADADLVLWVTDATAPVVAVPAEFAGLGERLREGGEQGGSAGGGGSPRPGRSPTAEWAARGRVGDFGVDWRGGGCAAER